MSLVLRFLLLAGVLPVVTVAAELPRGPGLGLILDPGQVAGVPPGDPTSADPLTVRLTARWSDVERQPGVYDWAAIESAVATLEAAGHRVTLCLTGTNRLHGQGRPPSPVEGTLDPWLGFVRSAARNLARRVALFEVWEDPARDYEPSIYAFLLKQSALALRAEARAAGGDPAVAQGALDPARLDWQLALWSRDTAAYVDVLPLRFVAGAAAGSLEQRLAEMTAAALEHPPAPALWAWIEHGPTAAPYAPLGDAVRALGAGVSLAAVTSPADADAATGIARWVTEVHNRLSADYAPAPLGDLRVQDPEGRPIQNGRALARFLHGRDLTTLIVYDASAAAGILEQVRLIVDSRLVRNARSIDPVSGRSLRTAATAPPGDESRRSLRAPVAPYPMLISFERGVASPGFELPPEELEVETTRSLTAEEVIARHQQVQRIQDDALERWIAKGRIDFHFKLAQGGSTVDVSIDSNYFWERGGPLEWEQTVYYVNGNKVRWKKIPELPLIQPEKVVTLPLDLTLDKSYVYRLAGEDRVGEREAYVLGFQPAADGAASSLYQGRVWIDKRSFQRLKVSLVQTRTGTPEVLSNEERDLYAPHEGLDGESYWLLSKVDGQQVWSAGGRNFVVRREVTFSDFEINLPAEEFEQRRQRAYSSQNQVLRDTEAGFRYLERQPDGSRTVKEGVDTSQLFAAAGAFRDSSTNDITPLAGVNYFNYDLFGKKIQFNALTAGAVNFVTASKADLFGRKISGTVEGAGVAIKFEDKFFTGADESRLERIEQRPQNLSLRLGVPMGAFFKLTLVGGVTWRDYFLEDGSEDLLETFRTSGGPPLEYRLPEDHLESRGSLELEFNRTGWNVTLRGSFFSRSDWQPFGLFDPTAAGGAGTFVRFGGGDPLDPANYAPVASEPVEDRFTRWGASAFKEWYLPKFQKVRGELNYLEGADLDRFSRFEFSFFGDDRLNGFSGSGVRFDRGLIARAGYAFNLFEVIRLDAALESARVRREDDPVGEQSFSGVGLSGNFIGPWKTVISINYGYALASDIPALEGEQEFLLLVFKLF